MYIVLLYSIWMSICGYIYTFLWFLRQTDAFLKFLWPCIQVLIEWRSCTYVGVVSITYSRYINIRYAGTVLVNKCLNMALVYIHTYDILYRTVIFVRHVVIKRALKVYKSKKIFRKSVFLCIPCWWGRRPPGSPSRCPWWACTAGTSPKKQCSIIQWLGTTFEHLWWNVLSLPLS